MKSMFFKDFIKKLIILANNISEFLHPNIDSYSNISSYAIMSI
jgi:ribosomal protein L30E